LLLGLYFCKGRLEDLLKLLLKMELLILMGVLIGMSVYILGHSFLSCNQYDEGYKNGQKSVLDKLEDEGSYEKFWAFVQNKMQEKNNQK